MENKEFDYQGKRPDQVNDSTLIGGLAITTILVDIVFFLIRLLINL